MKGGDELLTLLLVPCKHVDSFLAFGGCSRFPGDEQGARSGVRTATYVTPGGRGVCQAVKRCGGGAAEWRK